MFIQRYNKKINKHIFLLNEQSDNHKKNMFHLFYNKINNKKKILFLFQKFESENKTKND